MRSRCSSDIRLPDPWTRNIRSPREYPIGCPLSRRNRSECRASVNRNTICRFLLSWPSVDSRNQTPRSTQLRLSQRNPQTSCLRKQSGYVRSGQFSHMRTFSPTRNLQLCSIQSPDRENLRGNSLPTPPNSPPWITTNC